MIQTFLNEKPGNAPPDSSETCFDRFDYMSTVSGGGYIGSAVSWLKHHFGKGGNWRTYLGASNLGARSAEFRADGIEGVDGSQIHVARFLPPARQLSEAVEHVDHVAASAWRCAAC